MSTAIRTPVVQFGTSRFLQAHADLFIHEAKAGPITVVASSGSESGRARVAAFGDPAGYPVIIRGMEDGAVVDRKVQVTSVARGLDAVAHWAELSRIVATEAKFLISNTTEAGFAVPAGLALDLSSPLAQAPPSFPARLLALIAARFAETAPGLVVLPTELVGRNGDTLKAIVLALARASRASDALIAYIGENCVFANSLVDRIVSSPIEPAGAVAEPYALWAVETQPGLVMPCEHPAIRVVADLEPFERLKIHILNLGHSVLADHWMTRNLPADAIVRQLLAQPETRAMLDRIYDEEVLPGFAARRLGAEAAAYRTTTMERFDNPFLDHRLSDIASGHVQKVDRRIAGFMGWIAATDAPPTPALADIAKRTAERGDGK